MLGLESVHKVPPGVHVCVIASFAGLIHSTASAAVVVVARMQSNDGHEELEEASKKYDDVCRKSKKDRQKDTKNRPTNRR